MCDHRVFSVILLASSLVFGNWPNLFQQEQEKRTVTRVKRPEFDNSSRNEIYFSDIFTEALIGERPAIDSQPAGKSGSESANSAVVDSSEIWSRFISRDAIEDEVKMLHQGLQASITTPSGFNSRFREVRQQLELLSMLFGIIHEYDQEIRWKKYAGSFQKISAETATKARSPSRPAFQASKLARDDLGELIRGGGVEIDDKVAPNLEWSSVIQRRPIMVQLENAVGEVLKPGISSKDEFQDNKDKILRTANLVSAMAKVLIKDGMDEADDDGYADYAKTMGAAAKQLILATQSEEFETAAAAVNKIEQSCVDCHSEWR